MLDMDVVYNDYAQTVFKFLMTLCHDEHTAEELTQETFYQAVRCAGNLTEHAKSPPGSAKLQSTFGTRSWINESAVKHRS